MQSNYICGYNKMDLEMKELPTSMRKSPVLSPACHATPPSSTDSRYCNAGKAGVGVNSSMGVSATQQGRTEVKRIIEKAKRNPVTTTRHSDAHKEKNLIQRQKASFTSETDPRQPQINHPAHNRTTLIQSH